VIPKLEQLNNNLPNDIIIVSYTEVSVIFNPRHNLSKTYSYYLSKKQEIFALDRMVDFVGTHNFSQFIKADGAGSDNPVNTIFDTTIQESFTYYRITITGNRFGREQIRRMVGFFLQKKYQNHSLPSLLNNTTNFDIRSAPPTFLVLDQITFDQPISWVSSSHLGHIYQKIMKEFEYDLHRDQVSLNMLRDILTQVD
jgi:tRNA pseudouridine(38-40) synthase